MINIILIDDEPLARALIAEYLQSYPDMQVVAECGDGFEGVKAIAQFQPDLIFLDIQMPKINGFEMLELIDLAPSVIFTTAFDEYAVKAFESNAIDYLLKPFSQERFDKAMQKWLGQKALEQQASIKATSINFTHSEESSRVVVKNGTKIKIIPTSEIIYLEAYDDYVKIYTSEGFQLKKKTMSYFESVFDPVNFLRVHRSFLVQLNQITRIEMVDKNAHIALLKNGVEIPLSRSGYLKLKEILGV